MRISELEPKQLDEILGVGEVDASDGVLFRAVSKMQLDQTCRSIILGLGGTGIRAVNMIKASVTARFDNSGKRVSFLAIDTDDADLERCSSLDACEKHWIDCRSGDINKYFRGDRDEFINTWCAPKLPVEKDLDLRSKGAGQFRQACKMKMYFPSSIMEPNDKQIADAIRSAINRADPQDNETLRFYVVLGVSGGTGSGGIIEIAKLIRAVRNFGTNTKITGIFVMPDAMMAYGNGIKSNGYAALKELDYYNCARQREDPDSLALSQAVSPAPIKINRDNNLYDMTILVSGSINGTGELPEKNKRTLNAVAESVVNLLADSEHIAGRNADAEQQFLLTSFFSNMGKARENVFTAMFNADTHTEKANLFGEDSYDYCAIGVGTAAIPEKIVKAYVIEQILRTISGETDGFVIDGFRGFDKTPCGKHEAESAISKLLADADDKAIERKIKELSRLSNPGDFLKYSINDILSETADGQYAEDLRVKSARDAAIPALDKWLRGQYSAFVANVEQYMMEHGPRAFVWLCEGIGPDATGYTGLESHLLDMKPTINWMREVEKNKTALEATRKKLEGFWGKVLPGWKGHCDTWHSQFKSKEEAGISQMLSEHLYGQADLALQRDFVQPALAFISACRDFANVLDKLLQIYKEIGYSFQDQSRYSGAAADIDPNNYNIINTDKGYDWAKRIADASIRAARYQDLKQALIHDFIMHPQEWTNYEPEKPAATPRRRFDQLLASKLDGRSYFEIEALTLPNFLIATNADKNVFCEQIVEQLLLLAKPRFHGAEMGDEPNVYILVPKDMLADPAMRASFQTACQNHGATMYETYVQDKIICYRFRAALPIYALTEIDHWQSAYEAASKDLLHSDEGTNPEFIEAQGGVPWVDRPPITYKNNIRRATDASDRISREGRYLNEKLDPFFDEALKCGLIKRINAGKDGLGNDIFYYEAYPLNQPNWNYAFDAADYGATCGAGNDVALDTGKPLMDYFARKNRMPDGKNYVRRLALEGAHNFNEPMPESMAKDRALRILRKNVPLYIRLRASLEPMQRIAAQIEEENRRRMTSSIVPLFVRALALDVLQKGEAERWSYTLDGKKVEVCRMVGAAFDSDTPESAMFENNVKARVLLSAFAKKLDDNGFIALKEAVNESWQDLVDAGGAAQIKDCLDSLRWACDEAETVLGYYVDGRRSDKRAFLQSILQSDEEEMLERLYREIQRTYKNLEQLM